MTGKSSTKTKRAGNGHSQISPERVERLFEDGYREIEVLKDGSIRERAPEGDFKDEVVTRSLKTGRTWY